MLIILGVVGLIGVGIFSLSSTIVNRGYSSEKRLVEEKEEEKEEQRVVEVPKREKEIGNHGSNYNPGEVYDVDEPVYRKRVKDILNMEDSPYNGVNFSIDEVDLSTGEKKFTIKSDSDGSTLLEVYGNNVDYAPYMFTSTDEFSEEEIDFFENLQNGEQGYNEETGEYYWLYY